MIARAIKAELKDIQSLRALFLQETNFQIRYNSCHERGWTDSYLLIIDDVTVGYGSTKGQEISNRDTVFEFFVIHSFAKLVSVLFRELLSASGAKYIECQSNDMLLSSMLYEFSRDIGANVVLFEDHAVTEHVIPDGVVRPRCNDDQIFEHKVEPVGDYVLALPGGVVATGGFMVHYNRPFTDLYMEVREDCRRRGFGSFLLQELKKQCYLIGSVPAARCNLENTASRGALIKAGLRVCGFMLTGKIKTAGC
ncbi:MAG TPA: GNAT family N-acetyltransferase [Terriglobia bacterium]|nr:GNAT family N-acetyltransferase [Terriglobia bacterium]